MNSEPLLWLPGLLCNHFLFDDLNKELSSIVAPSVIRLEALQSMESLAKSILNKAPERFVLGGLSMGGILAFEIYRQAPERINGLILMDTNAADEKEEVTINRNKLVDIAINGQFEVITPNILMSSLIHSKRLGDLSLTTKISDMAIDIGLDAFKAHAKALASRSDSRALLSEINVPTLIITGREDALCPIDNHLYMAKEIYDAELHIIPECGHLSSMECSSDVASRVNSWLIRNF